MPIQPTLPVTTTSLVPLTCTFSIHLLSPSDLTSQVSFAGSIFMEEGRGSEGDEAKRLKKKAAESFLASAKLNPNYAAAFRSLGLFYEQVAGDRQRAAKCYQRAVTLNPDDITEAGVSV